jgi:hypothetical protein
MNQDNRVLARHGAGELTPSEIDQVSGGVQTGAPCSFNPITKTIDGPPLDCHS